MVVFVHSLGSLWQEKVLPAGGTRIWNTTGIRDGDRVRSCAKVFGQLRLGARARAELCASREITGAKWVAGELAATSHARTTVVSHACARGISGFSRAQMKLVRSNPTST